MIRIFTGEDRVRAIHDIKQFLGDDYEVIEAANLTPSDLPSIFRGTTLFATERRILIRDFTLNSAVYPELVKYLDTPHLVALLETKLDKRSATYKCIKDQVSITEYKVAEKPIGVKFDIYRIAKRDGKKAIEMLRHIEDDPTEDPIMFVGLIASQVLKEFAARPQGIKERECLKALAAVDLATKTTNLDGWLLVESFLLRMSKL